MASISIMSKPSGHWHAIKLHVVLLAITCPWHNKMDIVPIHVHILSRTRRNIFKELINEVVTNLLVEQPWLHGVNCEAHEFCID